MLGQGVVGIALGYLVFVCHVRLRCSGRICGLRAGTTWGSPKSATTRFGSHGTRLGQRHVLGHPYAERGDDSRTSSRVLLCSISSSAQPLCSNHVNIVLFSVPCSFPSGSIPPWSVPFSVPLRSSILFHPLPFSVPLRSTQLHLVAPLGLSQLRLAQLRSIESIYSAPFRSPLL